MLRWRHLCRHQKKMSGKHEAAASNYFSYKNRELAARNWLWRIRLGVTQKGPAALVCRRWDISILGNFWDSATKWHIQPGLILVIIQAPGKRTRGLQQSLPTDTSVAEITLSGTKYPISATIKCFLDFADNLNLSTCIFKKSLISRNAVLGFIYRNGCSKTILILPAIPLVFY